MEKRVLVYQKTADKEKNRIIIPIQFIRKYGKQFYMEVHEDKLVILPVNTIKKEGE